MPPADPPTPDDVAKIEAAAKNKLHGVAMPKVLDFSSKKLHHEYAVFKTLATRVIKAYAGLPAADRVEKILLWMGPEACLKHDNHPFTDEDRKSIEKLWELFDGICAKKEGAQGSWHAARMELMWTRQEKGESVDAFYTRIREKLKACEYTDSKLIEEEVLKYGLTDPKLLEKVYALPKTATVTQILDAARAEETVQRHLREASKVQRETVEAKGVEELRKSKKTPSKSPGKGPDIDCNKCG